MLMLVLRLFLKDKGGDKQHCLIPFVGSNLGLRHFWKRWNIRKGCVAIEYWGTLYTLHWGFEKILCKASLSFICFLVIKGILKTLFSFIPWLLNFSNLPNYGSNSRKIYTLRLLSKCLVNPPILSLIHLDWPLLA